MGRALTTGTAFEGYRIDGFLGEGATAKVYRATHPESGREVALKVLRRGFSGIESRKRRFEREARAMAQNEHPNIIGIYEVGRSDEVPFIAMELVSGESLRQRLERETMEPDEAVAIARQVATGLEAAHRSGIVHRDLKPENIMVTDDGQAKILDFGLSKSLFQNETSEPDATDTSEALTLPGTILGTLEYMSPEQASGCRVDFRSDQFAFGSILYEMLCGFVAFQRETATQILAAVIEGRPAPLRTASEPLRAIVERCLQKKPGDRFAGMGEVREALEIASAKEAPQGWFAASRLAIGSIAGAFLA